VLQVGKGAPGLLHRVKAGRQSTKQGAGVGAGAKQAAGAQEEPNKRRDRQEAGPLSDGGSPTGGRVQDSCQAGPGEGDHQTDGGGGKSTEHHTKRDTRGRGNHWGWHQTDGATTGRAPNKRPTSGTRVALLGGGSAIPPTPTGGEG
jgi:hypothetical protein